jgi:TfoX/Sxy family transcriptional regulator of competence genes
MASDAEFVQFITDQISDICGISSRKMFGEYALYSNGKIVALICDNQLFIKPTEAGRKYIGKYVEAPPYPGAKNALLIQDQVDDSEWLSELIRVTEQELPMPKEKKKISEKNEEMMFRTSEMT